MAGRLMCAMRTKQIVWTAAIALGVVFAAEAYKAKTGK